MKPKTSFLLSTMAILALCALVFMLLRERSGVSRVVLAKALDEQTAGLEQHIDARCDKIEDRLERIESKLDRLLELATPTLPDDMSPAG